MQTRAPAKVILFGEHAVVYGQPAIAVHVSALTAEADVTPGGEGLHIIAEDTGQTLPVTIEHSHVDNALTLMATLTLRFLNQPAPNATIRIHSAIPLASGLGSGAAVSAALGRAIAAALNTTISDDDLNKLVYEVERMHHGTPSGIDNTVIVYEKPVYFVREEPIEMLNIHAPFQILIGDTGKKGLTRESVGDVRKLYDANRGRVGKLFNDIGQIVKLARVAIEQGQVVQLGELMNRNHTLLQELTVSSPELDALCDAARAAGAYGAKLSGGGRGGNMIALIEPSQQQIITEALMRVGAARVYTSLVGA